MTNQYDYEGPTRGPSMLSALALTALTIIAGVAVCALGYLAVDVIIRALAVTP